MSLHLKLLDINNPLTFEESKLRQIEAHALIYLSNDRYTPSLRGNPRYTWNGISKKMYRSVRRQESAR